MLATLFTITSYCNIYTLTKDCKIWSHKLAEHFLFPLLQVKCHRATSVSVLLIEGDTLNFPPTYS